MSKLTYKSLKSKINNLKQYYDYFSIGKSVLGEEIYVFHIGSKTGKQVVVEAGIHAREYISTLATIEEISHTRNNFFHFNYGIYFIPLVNPDGVRLVLEGCDFIQDKNLREFLLKLNNNSTDFSLWKANIRGVDLNSNFSALWGKGRYNKFSPAPEGFVGPYPNSEPENQNLISLLKNISIAGSLSIHTKGEVVYYGYDNLSHDELKRDEFIATSIANYLGFVPEKTIESVGGFSDYISETYHVPAFTIELGNDALSHPLSVSNLKNILPSFLGVTNNFITLVNNQTFVL